MGRLQKSIVDKIVKLRKEGYTQSETAEKVGVHLKSVQKYDPLRRSASGGTIGSLKTRSTGDLVAILKTQGDLIDALLTTLRFEVEVKRILCPSCMEGGIVEENGVYICSRCGYAMKMFANVWDPDHKHG